MKRTNKSATVFFELLESRALMSTVVVTNLNDSGAGSLRQAIASASSGDTIQFGSLYGTITLQSPLSFSGKSLTVTGSGRSNLTIDASAISQAITSSGDNALTLSDLKIIGGDNTSGNGGGAIFIAGNSTTDLGSLTLSNVDITGGSAASFGGGIYSDNANLELDDCNVYDNHVSGNTADGGGVFFQGGTLTISGSSFYDNTAISSVPAAYALGGGIFATGTSNCFLTNCTIADNTVQKTAFTSEAPAPAGGGGMFLEGSGQILACTFAYNQVLAPQDSTAQNVGGGLYLFNLNTTTVQNTLVAKNVAPASADMFSTSSTMAGYDLVGDGTGSGATNGQFGSIVGTTASPLDPVIGQLADNGGGTKTIALLAGSPAINAAFNNGPASDQRGVARVGAPDIGAYEYSDAAPTFQIQPQALVNSAQTMASLTSQATAGGDLTYQWTVIAKPAHSANPVLADGTAADTTASFSRVGTYRFRLTASTADGQIVTSEVTVHIAAIASSLRIVQHKKTFTRALPTALRAIVYDQFGFALADQPSISWSLESGTGAIDPNTGVYTPAKSGSYSHLLIRATAGALTGIAGDRVIHT